MRSVVFEALRRDFGGQWVGLTQAVAWVAIERGLYPAPNDTRIVQIDPADAPRLRRYVSQLVDAGIMTDGIDGMTQASPRVLLTDLGREVISRNDDSALPDYQP